jgi:hypothetical protein
VTLAIISLLATCESFHPLVSLFPHHFGSGDPRHAGCKRLTISVYIWGEDESARPKDPSERIRWIGKIEDIRAKAKDRVFM